MGEEGVGTRESSPTFGTADATVGARPDAAARRGAPREARRALETTRARSAIRARDAMPAPGDAAAATHDDTVIVVLDARWQWLAGAGETSHQPPRARVNNAARAGLFCLFAHRRPAPRIFSQTEGVDWENEGALPGHRFG